MQWKSLPRDLVEDILSRVPAVPLARFRSTSKQWNAILKSRSFAKLHTAKSPKDESLFITLIDSKVRFVRINFHDPSPSVKVAAHPFYLKDPLSYSSKEVHIRNVFQCDGLLLCSTKDNRLVVWEPYSGETKWIKPRDRYEESDFYALGYDNKSSCKQYKILRVNRPFIIPVRNEYEIYDFTSDSWRVLGVATDWYLGHKRIGISVKGNTYWVATKTGMQRGFDFILSFDFSKGMFQSLPLPNDYLDCILALSVVKEEQLCLLGYHILLEEGSFELQGWVTTSTGSWNKSLALKFVAFKDAGCIDISITIHGVSFLADEQEKVLVCLSPNNVLHILRENQHTQYYLGEGRSAWNSSFSALLNYAPSLAQIQQGTLLKGRKRKAQSM